VYRTTMCRAPQVVTAPADLVAMGRATIRRDGPRGCSLLALFVTLALLPICTRYLGPTTSGYVSAVLAVVVCVDLLSMWLLTGEYSDTGDRRMLAMGMAYLWSLVLVVGYALAFPGVISTHPPLAFAPSVAPYLYLGWHVGFPVLLGAAWSPSAVLDRVDQPGRRPHVIRAATVSTSTLAIAAILGCVVDIHRLPVLIHGVDTTAMTKLTAPIALPLVAVSLVLCTRGVHARTGPERWTQLAISVCACDLLLTYVSRHRYSLGWYAGRTLTVTAAATILVAMLASFRKLKAVADFNAAYDALTGLPNRRSTYDALASMVARAQRGRTQLTVVMVDLDHFKRINDTYGHAAGDEVLRAVAATMRATLRDTDIIGRVGGEEFLILLPDAADQDARAVVERLRDSLRLIRTAHVESGVTASFGIAMWEPGDAAADTLTNRADHAMYRAKDAGRDRIVISA
jgi:diguanylate cyclase (GGDEF)-like protein